MSCSTSNPRHGQHVPRQDGSHFVSGGLTEAQTDSTSRARQRRQSSSSSSSSSDPSSSTCTSSFSSKASNHNSKSSGSFSSKLTTGSENGLNESRSDLTSCLYVVFCLKQWQPTNNLTLRTMSKWTNLMMNLKSFVFPFSLSLFMMRPWNPWFWISTQYQTPGISLR